MTFVNIVAILGYCVFSLYITDKILDCFCVTGGFWTYFLLMICMGVFHFSKKKIKGGRKLMVDIKLKNLINVLFAFGVLSSMDLFLEDVYFPSFWSLSFSRRRRSSLSEA